MNLKRKVKFRLNETESTLGNEILMSTLFHCLISVIEHTY